MTIFAYVVKAIAWLRVTLASSSRGISDVIASIIPQVVRAVMGFMISVLLARGLGPSGLGQYTLAMSFSDLVVALSDLGIGQTAVRYASRSAAFGDAQSHFEILRWAFRLRLVLVFLMVVIVYALAPSIAIRIWHLESLTLLIRLSLFTGAFGALAAIPIIYFQSLKRFEMIAKILVGQTLISFSGILLLALLNRWSIYLAVMVTLVATGVGAITFLFSIPRAALFPPKGLRHISRAGTLAFWRNPIQVQAVSGTLDNTSPDKFTVFMLLSSIIVMLILRVDVWLMGVLLDKSQIGLYSAAMRFTLPLTMVLYALNNALWPRASALIHHHEILALLRKTFGLCALAAGIGLIYAIVAPLLAPAVFGSKYASSVLLGQLLCFRYCLAILIIPVGVIGYSFGLVRIYWLINLVQLIVVVIMNVLMLPVLGPIGSAVALIVNEIIGFAITGVMILRQVRFFKEKDVQ